MLVEIPISGNIPDDKFTIILDQVVYVLRIKWNSRTGRFVMDISLEDGTILAQGICLCLNSDFMSEFTDSRLPKGKLFVVDTTDKGQEPTEENFGKTTLLMYNEA